VVAFSLLYKTIPVIATYDRVGDELWWTLRRPWIASEARAFRTNPTRVIYVGHNDQGSHCERHDPTECPWRSVFGQLVSQVWSEGFTETILGVLSQDFEMASVSDLRYILPSYARDLTVAFQKMTRIDYLLTAAILCQTRRPTLDVAFAYAITDVNFERYIFSGSPSSQTDRIRDTDDITVDICLDGVPVAIWGNESDSSYVFYLQPLPNAERVILAALGLTESSYRERRVQKKIGIRRIVMESRMQYPLLEVFSINMPPLPFG
jgi:hypothetical protein